MKPLMSLSPWVLVLMLLNAGAAPGFAGDAAPKFMSGRPIWPEGREKEKNLSVGFRATFTPATGQPVLMRATGSTLYRVFLNGEFLGHGPARGPHGFYRVDEWDLSGRMQSGANTVAFEVAGYNANSYYLLDQPSFLQAEVIQGGQVLASTAGSGAAFEAQVLTERVQKVQRYSFQRPFSEVYGLAVGSGAWRTNTSIKGVAANCAVQPAKALLARGVPFSEFAKRSPSFLTAFGTVEAGAAPKNPWKDRSLTGVGSKLGGYPEKELTVIPSLELQRYKNTSLKAVGTAWSKDGLAGLKKGQFQIVDFGVNLSGFIGLEIVAQQRTRLALAFDEVLSNGDVDFKRLGCVNVIDLELEAGAHRYAFESFEPYTLRYLKVIALDGECEVKGLYLREYTNPDVWKAHFAASDERFNRLFAAGRETFGQNAVDIFMDCPSRERAGWLCDSFFTARTALDLSGHTKLERCFLENYLLPPKFEHLPEGMLPMCYPADHNDGVFIPNWAMWFVVELEEYLARSGDRELVAALEPRVMKLLDYFKKFRNEDGLLEKLESWVFVEWSKANDFVQDVNYPSSMLYAKALSAAGKMYNRPELAREAERIREVIRKQSFDGEFFVDNAKRRNGKLEVTRNRSEVCQYFAFFFDVATPESHPKLWHALTKDFGPQRKQTKAFPEVHPANAFIGNVLRLELLSRYGLCQQLLDESLLYQLYMVERTGTLWENDGAYASCNHGFASHGGVHVLYRDVLGLQRVDTTAKKVQLRFTDLNLQWCEGRMPTPDGLVELRWRKENGKLVYQVAVPAGYEVAVENRGKLELARQP